MILDVLAAIIVLAFILVLSIVLYIEGSIGAFVMIIGVALLIAWAIIRLIDGYL